MRGATAAILPDGTFWDIWGKAMQSRLNYGVSCAASHCKHPSQIQRLWRRLTGWALYIRTNIYVKKKCRPGCCGDISFPLFDYSSIILQVPNLQMILG